MFDQDALSHNKMDRTIGRWYSPYFRIESMFRAAELDNSKRSRDHQRLRSMNALRRHQFRRLYLVRLTQVRELVQQVFVRAYVVSRHPSIAEN